MFESGGDGFEKPDRNVDLYWLRSGRRDGFAELT
jgi:hypothetical protein